MRPPCLALLFLVPTLFAAACNGDKTTDTGSGGGGDGGADGGVTDGGSADGGSSCTVAVVETEPDDGETGWFWRDELTVTLDGATDDVSFRLVDSSGTEIPLTESWSEGGLVATLTPGEGMTGLEVYTLTIDVCGTTTEVAFETDEYGLPLEDAPESLVGHTYYLDLPGATFVQPAGVGALLSTFLDVPILAGVTAASETSIDLLGAQAMRDSSDNWVQDTDQLTWDFPAAPFDTAPFFETTADEIVINYSYGGSVYAIPVYDFHIEGTLSADGQRIGGAIAMGKGDTKNMGPMLGAGDEPDAVCKFFASVGLECEDCGDGTMTCLTLEAHFPEATLLEGVELVEVTGR
ncbi:MAG: hypothetical protein D6798_11560 [Deltaproteobacteria bacterium]|nr:MAG: hypothetical protein D6798_11560 [Deltaproteobacteria bacterium]